MAIPAAWFIISWGGNTLYELRDIDAEFAVNGDTAVIPRSGVINVAPGTGTTGRIVMTGFSPLNLGPSQLGQIKLLDIKARRFAGHPFNANRDTQLWKGYCRYEGYTIRATVNGAVLFAFAFKFMTQPDVLTGTDTAPDISP